MDNIFTAVETLGTAGSILSRSLGFYRLWTTSHWDQNSVQDRGEDIHLDNIGEHANEQTESLSPKEGITYRKSEPHQHKSNGVPKHRAELSSRTPE